MRFLFSLFILLLLSASSWAEQKPTILVSVGSYKFFVQKIAGNTVDVLLMVPAGADLHTYEPTPKEILAASQADLWFTIGESFEKKALDALRAYYPQLTAVDLRQGVDMIAEGCHSAHCHCHAGCEDPHIWMSARQAKIQAYTIAEALKQRYPEHKEAYDKALTALLADLDALDRSISNMLQPLKRKTILVSHPAYGYFCRDYNLTQLSIEMEGKEPTPQQLTRLLQAVYAADIRRVYVQPQYSGKGAKLIADELGAEVVVLNPISEHYMKMMEDVAEQFAKN